MPCALLERNIFVGLPKCGFSPTLRTMLELPVRTPLEQPPFLPMSRSEMETLGWEDLDVLLVCGDAYVDHPAFGVPLLGRVLVAHGYRTGLITQPKSGKDLTAMGRPKLFAGVSAGAIDSMLAHYTAFRRKRSEDAYTPGGRAGARPDRAVTVYAKWLAETFPDLPVIAGGIEASLRRAAHYDFWSDSLRPSLLLEAPLACVVFGMGETALLECTRRLDAIHELVGDAGMTADVLASFDPYNGIAGTARVMDEAPRGAMVLPSLEAIRADAFNLMTATLTLERETHQAVRRLVQAHGSRHVLLEPPAMPLSTEALDALYALPFSRKAHPAYTAPIPAEAMMRESITSHRGCGGGCAFCSLALHQGRRIASRSRESILTEVSGLAATPRFNGSISDVGGPSANMWQARCTANPETCKRESCMFPAVCPHFRDDQSACVRLLRQVADTPGIRNVRVASGVRFDLALKNADALEAYAGEFTGGQLKIAPEHCAPAVLQLMRKPGLAPFETFLEAFARYSRAHGKEQYVVPYLMSAHPGCTREHMLTLRDWLKARHWSPRQVQCFIPTPGTVATAMYVSGKDPKGRDIFVARGDKERRALHDLLFWNESGPARKHR